MCRPSGRKRKRMEPEQGARSEAAREGDAGPESGGATAPSQGNPSNPSAPLPLPSLQELRDLPRAILPEETYTHLKNAGREALLAFYHLWRSIDSARLGKSGEKVRKHIDIE